MIKMLEPMINEIQKEAVTTRGVLERVPADKLSWKPHPKSMSLGQLAPPHRGHPRKRVENCTAAGIRRCCSEF